VGIVLTAHWQQTMCLSDINTNESRPEGPIDSTEVLESFRVLEIYATFLFYTQQATNLDLDGRI
jgi:hypothetical protein